MFGQKTRRGHEVPHSLGTNLAAKPTGETALVIGMAGGSQARARLESMGLVPGAEVEVLSNGGRGPLLISLGEGRITLGRGVAEHVLVA